jgi:hypothetical protein
MTLLWTTIRLCTGYITQPCLVAGHGTRSPAACGGAEFSSEGKVKSPVAENRWHRTTMPTTLHTTRGREL